MKVWKKVLKRTISVLLVLSMIIAPFAKVSAENAQTNSGNGTESTASNKYIGDGFVIEFIVVSQWKGAFNGSITITNTGDSIIDNWALQFDFKHNITNIWNATIQSHEGENYIIKNADWNQDIPIGGSVNFGFSANNDGDIAAPTNYKIPVNDQVVSSKDYEISYQKTSDWGSGYNGQISITNHFSKAIEDWVLEFDFEGNITQFWTAQIYRHEGNHYIIKNAGYNANIQPGETISLGFTGSPGSISAEPVNYILNNIVLDNGNSNNSDTDNNVTLNIDMSGFSYNETDGHYYIINDINSLSGSLDAKISKVKSFTYAVSNDKGIIVNSGDISLSKDWTIKNIGFAIGLNKLDFKVTFNDGTLFETSKWILCSNENYMSKLNIDTADNDSDGINNYYEDYFGTDKNNTDSDGDGLSDFVELTILNTNPLKVDTDNDKVNDNDEDSDGDAINDLYEIEKGFNPLNPDSDGDLLHDNTELEIGTDPLNKDTDGDSFSDYYEYTYGLSPLVHNSPDEIVKREFTESDFNIYGNKVGLSLNIDMAVNQLSSLKISISDDNAVNSLIQGYIGEPYDISLSGTFKNCSIKMSFNPSLLDDRTFKPSIYYFNKVTKELEKVQDQNWNNGDCYVTANLEHFSTYILLNETAYNKVWDTNIIDSTNTNIGAIDIVTDSNNDGISDYYTNLLCKGVLTTGTGAPVFVGYSYEEIQSNNDLDNDGLINGEEIIVTKGINSHVFVKEISDPTKVYSDQDKYDDKYELKYSHTDPMVNDVIYLANDVDYVSNNLNFYSGVFETDYGKDLNQQLFTVIGNKVLSDNYSTTYIYKKSIMKYLQFYAGETEGKNEAGKDAANMKEATEYRDTYLSIFKAMSDNLTLAVEGYNKNSTAIKASEIVLRDEIDSIYKKYITIQNDSIFNAKPELESMYKSLGDKYVDLAAKDTVLSTELNFRNKFYRNGTYISNGFSIILGAVKTVLDVVDCVNSYSDFKNQMNSIQDNIDFLYTVMDNTADKKLKNACSCIIQELNNVRTSNYNLYRDISYEVKSNTFNFLLLYTLSLNSYVAVVIAALELADLALGISDLTEACTDLHAVTESAQLLQYQLKSKYCTEPTFYTEGLIGDLIRCYIVSGEADLSIAVYSNLACLRYYCENQVETIQEDVWSIFKDVYFPTYSQPTVESTKTELRRIASKYIGAIIKASAVGNEIVKQTEPTVSPTPEPTIMPTPGPTITPTPGPTITPTPTPQPLTDQLILTYDVNSGPGLKPFEEMKATSCTIDWGDGITDNNPWHKYDSLGIKTIKVTFDNLTEISFRNKTHLLSVEGSFNNCNNLESLRNCFYDCYKLKTISSELFKNCTSLRNVTQCFIGCDSLTKIPDGLFDNCPVISDFSGCFERCGALTTLPAGLFVNNLSARYFNNCFSSCIKLTSVPDELFKNCSSAITFDSSFYACKALVTIPDNLFSNCKLAVIFKKCFMECSSLTTIPTGLFDNCPNVNNFTNCFSECTILTTIPTGLFDNCPNVNSFNGCFYKSAINIIPPRLFDKCPLVTDFRNCFYGCNIVIIPNGLFDNCPSVSLFDSCFAYCWKLDAIPISLFDNCPLVKSFSYCFSYCYALTAIPTSLFDNCPLVTSFQECFANCYALTAIPEGIFNSCPLVKDFAGCFSYCTVITNIPMGLFDNCPLVTDFAACFFNCNELSAIPENLFNNCPLVTSFWGCFQDCNKLTTIPEGLFSNCSSVTNLRSCFEGCVRLTSIPTGIFDNCTLVTNASQCFFKCEALTVIPAGLFENCSLITNFGRCFSGCRALTLIPIGIFDNCKSATSFYDCFGSCSALTTIPVALFDDCISVSSFSYCFNGCSALTAIPTGLFDNCPLVTNFRGCFSNCSKLNAIPSGLFDNCKLVTDFGYCFWECRNLTGIAPALWNFYLPSLYNYYGFCFHNDINLSNYSDIPSNWR